MANQISFLPIPRSLIFLEGDFNVKGKKYIWLDSDLPQALLFTASRLQEMLKSDWGIEYEIHAGHPGKPTGEGITLGLNRHANLKDEGYRLEIKPEGILIEATTEAGIFYGCCTLMQILQFYSTRFAPRIDFSSGHLPCLKIDDWPDYPHRGVMLDISRDKVPTMETVFNLVDMLASWKINQFQLYTEHTFAYLHHPDVWADASPFTGEEVLRLDAFCRERFIELVPNQNSFGHLEHWLKLPAYNHLAEAPLGFDFPWGRHGGPFSLCPLEEGSLEFLRELYDELLQHFSSRQFNVGCDETFDLGQGRSKDECELLGTGRVYLDFLLKINKEVTQRGFRMQFWGDIIMGHPELVASLPQDSIALEWGYEADHPFEEHGAKFAQAGLPFYVCPGTSSWNSIAGRTDNCLENLANAAQNGLKHGAIGYLITDWGDNGHWQTLPVSYLGFAAGAAYAWSYPANKDLDIREALNRFAFLDTSGALGVLAYDLGNIYHLAGIEPPNASAFFHILQRPMDEWKDYLDRETALTNFRHALQEIVQAEQVIVNSTPQRGDHDLLLSEFHQTLSLLKFACQRGLFFYGFGEYSAQNLVKDLDAIIATYQDIWLKRNRPGGLWDSLAYFAKSRQDFLR